MAKQWEYRVETVQPVCTGIQGSAQEQLLRRLEELGDDGWEAFQLEARRAPVRLAGEVQAYVVYLKRPLPELAPVQLSDGSWAMVSKAAFGDGPSDGA